MSLALLTLSRPVYLSPEVRSAKVMISSCLSVVSKIEIFAVNKLPGLINRLNVKIGIICVPASSAQNITDIMIDNGILAIWNFAPIQVHVPSDIILENVQLSQSLGILTHKLAQKLKAY